MTCQARSAIHLNCWAIVGRACRTREHQIPTSNGRAGRQI